MNCGSSNAVSTNFAGVMLQPASPEFFTFLPDPVTGNNPIAAVNALTGVLIGAPGLLAGATFVPVKAGDVVEAFGTGWGLTNPAFRPGSDSGRGGIAGLVIHSDFGRHTRRWIEHPLRRSCTVLRGTISGQLHGSFWHSQWKPATGDHDRRRAVSPTCLHPGAMRCGGLESQAQVLDEGR